MEPEKPVLSQLHPSTRSSLHCWWLMRMSPSPRAAREQTVWEAWHLFQMPLLSSGGRSRLTAAVVLCKQVGDTLL